jgi:hypothetical protein
LEAKLARRCHPLFYSTIVSAIAGLAWAYAASNVMGIVRVGEAFASAIGTWSAVTIISPIICTIAVMRHR